VGRGRAAWPGGGCQSEWRIAAAAAAGAADGRCWQGGQDQGPGAGRGGRRQAAGGRQGSRAARGPWRSPVLDTDVQRQEAGPGPQQLARLELQVQVLPACSGSERAPAALSTAPTHTLPGEGRGGRVQRPWGQGSALPRHQAALQAAGTAAAAHPRRWPRTRAPC
jgi:hypothetical protein